MRRALRWSWVLVGLAALYAAVTMYSRWAANRAIEEAAVEERAEADRLVLEKLGGEELKILTLYANPPVLARGRKGLLCYGVANAETVRIEPAVEGVGPALSRCVEIRAERDTTFTLIATDSAGKTQSSEVVVRVQ